MHRGRNKWPALSKESGHLAGCFVYLREKKLSALYLNRLQIVSFLGLDSGSATGTIKKPQVLKDSKKAEIFYFPSCQNSSLCRKDNSLHPCPIFGYICSMDATMDLCCLRKQQKENTDRERERVPVSNLLAI